MKPMYRLCCKITLGLALILSTQAAPLACHLSYANRPKRVAAIGQKRTIKRKKNSHKGSARRYSQKELRHIKRILEKKFLTEDKTPALRNVVGFGIGANSVDVMLRWNTKKKQQEFRKQICNSPAIEFGNKLDPVIDNTTGPNSCQGISIQAEKSAYPPNSTEIKFIITNRSGKEAMYGEKYNITAQAKDGNWFLIPTDCVFKDVGHILSDGQSGTLTAHLFPDIRPNQPGTYRLFHEVDIDGKNVLLMATFELK